MKIIVPQGTDKIAFIADIHGIYENLLKAMELRQEIRYWFCAGDVVDMQAPIHVNAPMVRLMAKLKIPSIVGNHDRYVRKNALHSFEPESQKYLKDMPHFMDIKFAEFRVGVFHATPTSLDDFIQGTSEDSLFEKTFGHLKFDIFILGHTHRHYSRSIVHKQFFNPGALGPGIEDSTFCTLDEKGKVEFIFLNQHK